MKRHIQGMQTKFDEQLESIKQIVGDVVINDGGKEIVFQDEIGKGKDAFEKTWRHVTDLYDMYMNNGIVILDEPNYVDPDDRYKDRS